MKVWIDNTSLHGCGRCIKGTASNDHDIRNLLQLSSLIIFSDQIELGSFEGGEIFHATSEFLDALHRLGINQDLINRVDTTAAAYGEACVRAAEMAFDDILAGTGKAKARAQTGKFDLPIGAIHPYERLTDLLRSDDQNALDDAAERALELKGTGAIDYMIARSPNLRKSLRKLDGRGHWTEVSSFHISAYLRSLLNLELGRARISRYFPSSSRAQFLDAENSHARRVAHTIADTMDDAITRMHLREIAPTFPIGPIGIFLLERSRGAPEGIVETSAELREKLAPVRRDLEKISLGLGSIDRKMNASAKRAMDEMTQHVRIALGHENAPSLADCLKFELVLGATPNNDISFGLNPVLTLAKWIKYQLDKKRYYGVADVASVFARSRVDGRHFQALKSRAMKNV